MLPALENVFVSRLSEPALQPDKSFRPSVLFCLGNPKPLAISPNFVLQVSTALRSGSGRQFSIFWTKLWIFFHDLGPFLYPKPLTLNPKP